MGSADRQRAFHVAVQDQRNRQATGRGDVWAKGLGNQAVGPEILHDRDAPGVDQRFEEGAVHRPAKVRRVVRLAL